MARKRQSLVLPITIGVLALLFTISILVAWNIIFTRYYLLATESKVIPNLGWVYWLSLSQGIVFLVLVGASIVIFLVSNIRQVLYMREQRTFIDSVTHELKSPLASIRLCLDTMEMRDLDPETHDKLVGMMKDDVERLQAFIEQIFEAARLEHDDRALEYESIPLTELARSSAARIKQRYRLDEDAITLKLDIEDDELPIVTDQTALETILLNLLDNAVKYSPDGVNVDVRIHKAADWVYVDVRDEGIGIPNGQVKKVFRRFYRVERPDQLRTRGTGLGLYVVASLAQRLGGEITAESPGENQGSTFTLKLPLRENEHQLAA